jgi:hypothetical protein
MHAAAGITAARHDAAPGHHAVRELATSGTPIPPAPDRPLRTTTSQPSASQPRRRVAGTPRASTGRSGAPTGRNPGSRGPVRHGGSAQNSGRNSGSGIR